MDAVMKYISRIHRCFRQWQSDKMEDAGLNGIAQNYLFHICRKPGISQENLCEHIMVNKYKLLNYQLKIQMKNQNKIILIK